MDGPDSGAPRRDQGSYPRGYRPGNFVRFPPLELSTRALVDQGVGISNQARAAATRFISALARIELAEGTWPELLPWLWTLAASPAAAHREVALQALYVLLDTIIFSPVSPGGGITGQVPQLLELFRSLLGDESVAVRVYTVRALGKLAEFIELGEDREIVSREGGSGQAGANEMVSRLPSKLSSPVSSPSSPRSSRLAMRYLQSTSSRSSRV